MNKAELIASLAEQTGQTKAEEDPVINMFFPVRSIIFKSFLSKEINE